MMKNSCRWISFILVVGVLAVYSTSCKKSDNTDQFQYGTASDYEGSQTWMAENLRSIKLNDGTPIPYVSVNNTWSNMTSMAYSYYGNDSTTYKFKSGALYNWYTVDTKKLCPSGWHVPSNADWVSLNTYLGVDTLAGGKLKDNSSAYWYSPNLHATNETGFTALPCGYRFYNGSYNNYGLSGNWWTATEYSTTSAWYRYLIYADGKLGKNFYDKTYGFSVRCIKD